MLIVSVLIDEGSDTDVWVLVYVFQERQKWGEDGRWWNITKGNTDIKNENQYFFLFNLVVFGPLFFWFLVFLMPAGMRLAPPAKSLFCFVFSLIKLIDVPGSPIRPSGSDKTPWRHAADISDCSHGVLEERYVLVLVKKTVSTNVCCASGQLCFILYGGENIFHNPVFCLFVCFQREGCVWCKNVYRKFPFALI